MKPLHAHARYLAFTVFLTLLLSTPISAGTFDNLHFIGFSKDGKYMAFETYGTSDGTGHGYSSITLIDIAKNAWLNRPTKTGTESDMYSEQEARTINHAKVAEQLAKLEIVDGATGDHVITRRLTDLTDHQGPIRFAKFVHSMFQNGDFELHLSETAATSEECSVFSPPARKIFSLSLHDRKTGTTQILQKDKKLPKSRYCPDRYEISDVYVNNDLLVIFLRMYGPGFEGPDMRYLAVTGVIQ